MDKAILKVVGIIAVILVIGAIFLFCPRKGILEEGNQPEFLVVLTDNGENDYIDINYIGAGTLPYATPNPLPLEDVEINVMPAENLQQVFEFSPPTENLSTGENVRVFLNADVIEAGKVYRAILEYVSKEIYSDNVPAQPALENMNLFFETLLDYDGYYGYYNREYLVIENSEELERIWDPSESPPEVNFSTYMIIAVFMGVRPSGGYRITIEQITNMENEIVVSVDEIYPGRTAATTEVTYPNHIVKFGHIQKPVVFEVQQFKAHAYDENYVYYDEILYEPVGEYHVEPNGAPPEP